MFYNKLQLVYLHNCLKEHIDFDFLKYNQVLQYSIVEKCVYNLDIHGSVCLLFIS